MTGFLHGMFFFGLGVFVAELVQVVCRPAGSEKAVKNHLVAVRDDERQHYVCACGCGLYMGSFGPMDRGYDPRCSRCPRPGSITYTYDDGSTELLCKPHFYLLAKFRSANV